MEKFRFAIMGAGKIARKFCDAVREQGEAEVVAVASKSLERAQAFAQEQQIPASYDSYERMLQAERIDGVYIAVLPNEHYRLSMLCLSYRRPVLCEKAMFMNSREAKAALGCAQREGLFAMEALWSRFLPAIRQARQWVQQGRIGRPHIANTAIGFRAPEGSGNRYHSAALGGGAARDILVYAYELTTFLLPDPVLKTQVSVLWEEETGCDWTDHVLLHFPQATASLTATFAAPLEDRLEIGGEAGKIVVPHPHFASEAFLYDGSKRLVGHFIDSQTKNGFVYEIQEMISCVREGRAESAVVPHSCTIACAQLFDLIDAQKAL